MEAELEMAMASRRAAWKRQKADMQDIQLRLLPGEQTVQNVCEASCARFLKKHFRGSKEVLRQSDQTGLFQHIKPLKIEDTRKIFSQYISD